MVVGRDEGIWQGGGGGWGQLEGEGVWGVGSVRRGAGAG